MINLKKIQDAPVDGKTILLRADLDVPIDGEKIADDMRLKASLETIELLLPKVSKIIILGHLGRPEGANKKYTLEPVAKWYEREFQLPLDKYQSESFAGWRLGEKVILLENLRFNSREESNEPEFAKRLSELGEIYVNDAFASSHRAHASIVGISKFLPSFAGLNLQKEVDELSKVIDGPRRPLTIIVGGAKIETKLPLVERMHEIADYVLVGGEIAEHVTELLRVAHEKISGQKSQLIVADLTSDKKDISESSSQEFVGVIGESKTVVWNGPMGEFEKCFDQGTRDIANAIVNGASYSIVGGGDTVAFLEKEGLINKFSFVSTGGGAMLEFLSGEKLPGLEVIRA